MKFDLMQLYRKMLFSRLFEEEVTRIWNEGKISGEMHLNAGEEAVIAGVVTHLIDGDAMALDHRGTSPLLMRGIDPVLLLKEFLGYPDGLCSGMGGHMHLFSPEHLSASSGIVGASGPAAAGFALAGLRLRPGTISVAFFGEGAMNQGMLMESMNLAAAWKLPVLFVCRDNNWSITTRSDSVTGGNLVDRAKSFGLHTHEVDGCDVEAVWNSAGEAIDKLRRGDGPSYIHASCVHIEGHFLGDPLLRITRNPIKEMKDIAGPLMKSLTRLKGTSLKKRAESVASVTSLIGAAGKGQFSKKKDPLVLAEKKLKSGKQDISSIRSDLKKLVDEIVNLALTPGSGGA